MKRLATVTICLLLVINIINAQSVGIGTANPAASAQLDISSSTKGLLIPRLTTAQRDAIVSPAKGLMIFDSTLNNYWFYSGNAWNELSNGENPWTVTGNNIYSNNIGNVGIGTASPLYKLDVEGSIHSISNIYTDGYIGIGTTSPVYKLTIQDGSVAIYNSTDLKTWIMNYSSTGNYLNFNEGGFPRMVIANGGNVGIGTTSPTYKLDVAGNTRVTGDVIVTSDVLVNGNKGIIQNSQGSAQLKYYTRNVSVTAVLGAHQASPEFSIGFASGVFTNPPQVFVGNIVSTGGTVGELYRVIVVCYDVTTTGCHAKLINTDNASVNYDITFALSCIGN